MEECFWKSFKHQRPAQSKMASFWLFIFKNLAEMNEKRFFHSVNWFLFENIHNVWKNKLFEKKWRWRPKTKMGSGTFSRQNFDRQEFWATEFWPTEIWPTRILTDENFHRQNFDRREFSPTEFWPTEFW
jgi:hypothetical protein